jgi:maltose alpha-D-glucosyltransferase/alpha-amylase
LLLHVLEKAIYELGYELNGRPDWVYIPLKGINEAISELEKYLD